MTNSIGKDNALVGVCLHKDVKLAIGRAALADDRSVANFIFTAARKYWEQARPELAEQIRHILENAGTVAVMLLIIVGLGMQMLRFDQQLARRVTRRARRSETELAELIPTLTEPNHGEV